MIQFIIMITGIISITFVNSGNDLMVGVAPWVALIGQPFWLYTSFKNKQQGVFILSIVYTGSWIMGIVNQFV